MRPSITPGAAGGPRDVWLRLGPRQERAGRFREGVRSLGPWRSRVGVLAVHGLSGARLRLIIGLFQHRWAPFPAHRCAQCRGRGGGVFVRETALRPAPMRLPEIPRARAAPAECRLPAFERSRRSSLPT